MCQEWRESGEQVPHVQSSMLSKKIIASYFDSGDRIMRQMGHDLDTSGLDNGREWQSISELLPATLNCATSEHSLPICYWRCHVSSEIFLMRSHFCRRNRFMFKTSAAILFLIFLALIQTLSEK